MAKKPKEMKSFKEILEDKYPQLRGE